MLIPFLLMSSVIETSSQYVTRQCSEYFKYESDGTTTYGIIEVPPIQLGENLKLTVQLSLRSQFQDTNYGSLVLVGSTDTALESVRAGQNIKYKVNFPVQQYLPKVTEILYNGQMICRGSAHSNALASVGLEHTFITDAFRGTMNLMNINGITHTPPAINKNIYQNTVPVSNLHQNVPQSDCSKYFKYESDGMSTYGIIEVPPIQYGENLQINIKLSVRAQLQNKNTGSFNLLGSTNTAIESIKAGRKIKYIVTFPIQRPLPKFTKLLYNGKELCSAPGESSEQYYVTSIGWAHLLITDASKGVNNPETITRPLLIDNEHHTTQKTIPSFVYPNNPFFHRMTTSTERPSVFYVEDQTTQNTLSHHMTSSTQRTSTNNDRCGRPFVPPFPLILNGTQSKRGEHPWLVAMFVKKTRSLSFTCGATLISNKVVLTAAHCIHVESNTGQVDILRGDDIVLFFGKYNIDNWSENDASSTQIENIYVHEDYKRESDASYDADIAVIVMKRTIKFSAYIRPACLWEENTQIKNLVSNTGTVVGWGVGISGIYSNISNKIELPVVSSQTCIDSYEDFQYVMSDRTFCAGKTDGIGPCNGDSGGPFCFNINNRWYLRGIVSLSLLDESSKTCGRRNYMIFTDIVPFLSWIRSFL